MLRSSRMGKKAYNCLLHPKSPKPCKTMNCFTVLCSLFKYGLNKQDKMCYLGSFTGVSKCIFEPGQLSTHASTLCQAWLTLF